MKPLFLLCLAFSATANSQTAEPRMDGRRLPIRDTISSRSPDDSEKHPQVLDFRLHDNYLIVAKCSVGGKQNLIAIVDTGVTETVIDSKLVKRLSLPTTPDTATFGTRDTRVQAVSIPDITFGPLHTASLAGIAADLSYLTHQFGIRPDALLGMDLLRQGTFVIDYQRKQIVFGPVPAMKHSSPLLASTRLSLVQGTVENQRLTLQIDTGFNGVLIYGGRVHLSQPRSVNSSSQALGASVSSQVVTLSHLRIGDWRGNQITAAISDTAPKDLTEFDGLLGPTAIGVHRIGFDFQNLLFSWE